ncbi:MAG TPA: hypothetical protein VGQ10_02430 [Vicinamibacterales bacterium]|jgi:hypothetical protein|nr:hypothetical protein [Vicinamibacterales bacterium]
MKHDREKINRVPRTNSTNTFRLKRSEVINSHADIALDPRFYLDKILKRLVAVSVQRKKCGSIGTRGQFEDIYRTATACPLSDF